MNDKLIREIDFSVRTETHIPENVPLLLKNAIENVMEDYSNDIGYQVSVSIVTSEEIMSLNQEYRSNPYPTDVLSFPMDEETDPRGVMILGDIVINIDKVIEQARDSAINFEEWVVVDHRAVTADCQNAGNIQERFEWPGTVRPLVAHSDEVRIIRKFLGYGDVFRLHRRKDSKLTEAWQIRRINEFTMFNCVTTFVLAVFIYGILIEVKRIAAGTVTTGM
jgi:probable rRNA maturation factor